LIVVSFSIIVFIIPNPANHDPIYIEGDIEFKSLKGVSSGSGTPSDPYIIQGWKINSSANHGICIKNTTAYFKIRNCQIYGDKWNLHDGIYLENCSNGFIQSNSINNNYLGIFYCKSTDAVVSDNSCFNNSYGVFIENSKMIRISNNSCSNNSSYGVFINNSNMIGVSNNSCSNNSDNGICLSYSTNNTLSNNTLRNDGVYIWGKYPSHWNTHSIDTSNAVNGKPIRYYKNQTGMIVPLATGQIILTNCTNIAVHQQNISGTGDAIQISFSKNISIENNIFCNNEFRGISLIGSDGNILRNNICSNNGLDGISIGSSNNNILTNNNCSNNFDAGLILDSSNNNSVLNNTCLSNDNGICLFESFVNVLRFNNYSNNHYGIDFHYSSNNSISNNIISKNTGYGLHIEAGDRNIIWNGLHKEPGSNNTIWNNAFIGNNGAGSTYNSGTIQAFDDTTNNRWNSSDGYGNFWNDWVTPDIADRLGIVDNPYVIAGNAHIKDCYPLVNRPI